MITLMLLAHEVSFLESTKVVKFIFSFVFAWLNTFPIRGQT